MARRLGNPLTPTTLVGEDYATKRECKAWIDAQYSYIKTRRDLQGPPHFWRVPKAVRVTVTVTEGWEWTPKRVA